jgi:hypothetical protein
MTKADPNTVFVPNDPEATNECVVCGMLVAEGDDCGCPVGTPRVPVAESGIWDEEEERMLRALGVLCD